MPGAGPVPPPPPPAANFGDVPPGVHPLPPPIAPSLGMSDNMAGLVLEMSAALNSGHMRALEPRTLRSTTPTPFETFVAQSFVPAYQQQVAA